MGSSVVVSWIGDCRSRRWGFTAQHTYTHAQCDEEEHEHAVLDAGVRQLSHAVEQAPEGDVGLGCG